LLRRLIADADVLIEGYSPGTLERMGFGYEVLHALNPRLVYVQQSGLGQAGRYGRLRSFGPTAQAFSGLSEMSGLPAPYPPAGIGYSYLDWFGAYNVAIAALAGLQRRERTGEGCHIDSSQTEIGLYLTGTAVLDYSANGRPWRRAGNRSPGKPAAPCGAYPVRGDDRWVALSCFDDDQWAGLVRVLGTPEWAAQPRFGTLADRLSVQDELDELIAAHTRDWDGTELMTALQSAGVPAGVCQTAEDRCDNDPQLRHDGWLVELPQSEIGTWPVREVPFRLSETPPFIGGPIGRSGPNYGEDTRWLLRERLGCDDAEIDQLYAEGVM
jgi:crotonobetainyl-CoA:carnitine CoA-transferase CaiB-like acyl-CoA transferase